ncbi:hypothetical protein D9M68_498770 [compost metagenome]
MALLNIVIWVESEPNSMADPRTERVDVVKKYLNPSSRGLFLLVSSEVPSSNVMFQLIVLGVAKLKSYFHMGASNSLSNQLACLYSVLGSV